MCSCKLKVTTHERIHTGIIKFECRICDFKCNRFVWMEEHQKEEHGYICSVCQHKCAEWGALKDHTLQEHGGYLTSESNAGLTFFSFFIILLHFLRCSSSGNHDGSNPTQGRNFTSGFLFYFYCSFNLHNYVAVPNIFKHILRMWTDENSIIVVLKKSSRKK